MNERELIMAAFSGDLETVKRLIATQQIDLNGQDQSDATALHWAARIGHYEIVKLLLEHGADANVKRSDGSKALDLAAKASHFKTVDILLKYGANIPKNSEAASTIPLIVFPHYETNAQRIQPGSEIKSASIHLDSNRLFEAAESNDANALDALLIRGMNPNSEHPSGFYPLEIASRRGYKRIVETLLQHGANPIRVGSMKSSALMLATSQNHVQIVELLLSYGADPNAEDEKGWTPLGVAISFGNKQIIHSMIAGGANVNYININGNNPLNLALDFNNLEIFEKLLESGADPNITVRNGISLLVIAAARGEVAFAKSLIHHQINLEFFGANALTSATMESHGKVIKLLTENSVDCNGADKDNFTSLAHATFQDDYAIAELLLDLGPDPNADIRNNGKKLTPLHVAASNGHLKLMRLLLAHGGDPNRRDSNGFSVLDIAKNEGQTAVCEVLQKSMAQTASGQIQVVPSINRTVEETAKAVPTADISIEGNLKALLTELNSLIGLGSVKRDVMQLVNFLRIQQMRKEKRLAAPDQSLHMVFTGSPGTGKTTIARLIAQIYKNLKILSKGHFIETDRSGLVGGFLGQTAIKTRDVIESALGGVLFIDEAYSLTGDEHGRDMYGHEAIATLLKLMEDHRADLIVIVAGYTEPMKKFIKSNPGLQSRFNKFIAFEDYSPSELTSIFERFAAQSDYNMTEEAIEKAEKLFAHLHSERDETFGNARLARNLFENAINNQASRLVVSSVSDHDSLQTLTPDDIPSLA